MSIIRKIARAGKALIAAAMAEYQKIASPLLRLAVLAGAALLAFFIISRALPLLFLIGAGVAVWLIVKAATEKTDL